MSDINKVIILGRLTADPILKSTNSGKPVCTISIAVDQSYKDSNGNKVDKVSFFEASAWGALGEVISKYVHKGHKFGFVGHAEQQRWEDKDGGKRSKVVFMIEDIQFLQPKSDKSESVADSFGGQPMPSSDSPFDSFEDAPF